MTKIVGITGGIGSGKSTVSRIIERDWCPVYITDIEARKIQLMNPKAISGMKEIFGSDIYMPDGILNKKKLADIVFADADKLKALNGLIHPLVKEDFMEFVEMNKNQQFVCVESAILISSGFHTMCDFSILVKAPYETRISRVMQRDNVSRNQVEQRIRNQMTDQEMWQYCKYAIINDGEENLDDQIYDIFWKES